MRSLYFLSATFLIVALMALGCSGGNGTATSPQVQDNLQRTSSESGGTYIAGSWQVAVDLQKGTIQSVENRTVNMMLNVLGFMEPPALSNMNIDFATLDIDFVAETIGVDVLLTHPMSEADNVFQGFDVRGIVFGPKLANADGYTVVLNPADFDTVPFGYKDGLLGVPNSTAGYTASYWPYKYFCDGLGLNDDLATFLTGLGAGISDHRGKFTEGTTNTRHYDLSWAGLQAPITMLVFNYAVYANFDWPVGVAPHTTADYPITTANSAEAFCIATTITNNSLYFIGVPGGGYISMDIKVWDWQGFASTEVSVSDGTTTNPASFFGPGSDPFTGVFQLTDAPYTPTTTAGLDLVVTVTDNSVTYGGAWFFGLMDPGHPDFALPVANYWKMSVPVSDQPPCATQEPVDIEATPYLGTWLDDLTEDTACACEVENAGGTANFWTHLPATTQWNSGNTAGNYDADMNTILIGPKIAVPSTGGLKFIASFDQTIDAGEALTLGYILNSDAPIFVLTQGGSGTGMTLNISPAGLTPGDVISWALRFTSDTTSNVGTGATINSVQSEVFDPGPMPVVSDGGAPNPANDICTTGTPETWYYFLSGGYYYIYAWPAMPISFTWHGSPVSYWLIGESGWMFPAATVSSYNHRVCAASAVDRLIAFGDNMATCAAILYHPENAANCAGTVRDQVLNAGTATERWVIEYCDIGQIGESDTAHYRVIINGANNANPNDMRIEWIDVGSHVAETPTSNTSAYLIYGGVLVPIQCDYTLWANNTSADIDMP